MYRWAYTERNIRQEHKDADCKIAKYDGHVFHGEESIVFGKLFCGIGYCVICPSLVVNSYLYFGLLRYYERIIFAEESYLRDKFGSECLEWANRTPAFVPRIRQYRKADLPFSLRTVLKREYNGFFAAVVVMFLFEVVGDIDCRGGFDFDRGWMLLLTVSIALWMILRSLKKYAKMLNVDGR